MEKARSNDDNGSGLFRSAAIRSAGFQLFGDACIAMPPSATVSALLGILSTLLLLSALWIVEVPSRVVATGMLMPPEGLLDVVAPEAGQVVSLDVQENQRVRAGDRLLDVAPHGESGNGRRNATSELQSLREELELLDEVLERRRDLLRAQRVRLDGELRAAHEQFDLNEQRVGNAKERVGVLEARLSRLKELSTAGHVAKDALDREYLSIADARSMANAAITELSVSQASLQALISRSQDVGREIGLINAEHALRKEQLARQIRKRELLSSHDVTAPRTGTVARLNVKSGESVQKGQIVAKLFSSNERPQAWIYVPSASARRFDIGEEVELELNAWPAAKFGTLSATIVSVSNFVLKPNEVAAPVPVSGPVFEIRASIPAAELAGIDPGPGTTFRAQIVNQRYRLYQWLTRSILKSASSDHA